MLPCGMLHGVVAGRQQLKLVDAASVPTPPLKWAGGKRWQVPYLQAYWEANSNRRLVEPFCGGLAVALGLDPRRALLSDINPHLINFYRWLQSGLTVGRCLENDSSFYYAAREEFNRLLRVGQHSTADAATLFYYLNRTGYNGLCRFNSHGQFNVPFGRYKRINYRNDFREFVAAFENWTFVSSDFVDLDIESTDFVYADPPYDVEFVQYSAGGFDWSQQVRLAELLARHPGPVVLSNQATTRIKDLYMSLGYKLQFLDAPRRISCTGDREPAKEVLATRNL